MTEVITAIVSAVVAILIREYQRKRKSKSTVPPPPTTDVCKQCYFFKAFKRQIEAEKNRGVYIGDTAVIRMCRPDIAEKAKTKGSK